MSDLCCCWKGFFSTVHFVLFLKRLCNYKKLTFFLNLSNILVLDIHLAHVAMTHDKTKFCQ